jgi:hypothetical protein
MNKINNTIYFDSDDEFTDFCVAPYAALKVTKSGSLYFEGEYSDEYKDCIRQGIEFVIKDEDSQVFERQCVCKRVLVKESPRNTVLVQLHIENLKEYWECD